MTSPSLISVCVAGGGASTRATLHYKRPELSQSDFKQHRETEAETTDLQRHTPTDSYEKVSITNTQTWNGANRPLYNIIVAQ